MTKWETLNKLYLEQGLKIFPVVENGKTPLIKEWQKDCSDNYMQVLYWLENAPNCNWGLPATPNNLFIIDLDVHNENANGVENFDKIIDKLFMDADGYAGDLYDEWCEMGPLEQVTPSGGHHLIFQTDDELRQVPNCSNAFKDYPGIDIRTDGYIVVEPSTIGDNKYIFDTIPSAPNKMHPKLKKFILENVGTKQDNKKTPYVKPVHVPIGNRDEELFKYINDLYFKHQLNEDEITLLANHFNETNFEEPLEKRDVVYKIKKAIAKNRGKYIIVHLPEE